MGRPPPTVEGEASEALALIACQKMPRRPGLIPRVSHVCNNINDACPWGSKAALLAIKRSRCMAIWRVRPRCREAADESGSFSCPGKILSDGVTTPGNTVVENGLAWLDQIPRLRCDLMRGCVENFTSLRVLCMLEGQSLRW